MTHLSLWLFTALILAVGLERLAELVVSTQHASWAFARGGAERGQSHYPFMVLLHTGLLAGALAEAWLADRPFVPVLGWPMLALVVASQALRWWCISSLGNQWNTRVIVVPGLPLVRRGPYALSPHPNYVAVVVEGLALPLVHTSWLTAVIFTLANAALLRVRIRVEEEALRELAAPAPAAGGVG
ncbi:MAG: Isoprenylcysteine carboxyl methyltransferase [Humibacillus sp.]|nr:Isoprenylcysteine carboxyl methyltransferase [Humibacillus sp.]